ncbi:hypothetical protein BOX15_Mlig014269g1, partial [Macrostomum lignano]
PSKEMQHVLVSRAQQPALYLRWNYFRNSFLKQNRHCLSSNAAYKQLHLQHQQTHYSPLTLRLHNNNSLIRYTTIASSIITINNRNANCFLTIRCLSSTSPDSDKNKDSKSNEEKVPQVQQPKPSLPARIWHEIVHYWNGMRLLVLEIRIASRIGFKYMRGKPISRRERRHFVRTVADLFRMVPFLFFIVVPFMELLLPFYLKFMPFMLPSTFQEKDKEAEKLRVRLKAKLETAKFLQATLQEGFKTKDATDEVRKSLDDFRKFVEKCSTVGRYATTDELLRFSRLFADELTLDNLERPQLAAICKLLEVPAVGSKALIELQLEIRLRQLHADDQLIQSEGLDKLNVAELQAACRARGMRSLGMSEERLRQQLAQWLDLHLNSKVPTSLLLLSRSLHFPDSLDQEEMLRKTIAVLPQRAVASVEASSAGADNRTRLAALKSADADVTKEAAEMELAKTEEDRQRQAAVPLDGGSAQTDKSLGVFGSGELRQLESAISQVGGERLLQDQAVRDLKDAANSSTAESPAAAPTSKAEALLSKKLHLLVGEIDDMMGKVQIERQDLQRRINEELESEASDKLAEQLLSLNELQLALKRFQRNPDDNQWEKILPLLDEDNDGKIEIHHVTKVIEMLGSDNSRLSSSDLAKLLEALDKERLIMTTKDSATKTDGNSSNKSV